MGPLTPGYGYVPVIVNSHLTRHLLRSKSTSLRATYWVLPSGYEYVPVIVNSYLPKRLIQVRVRAKWSLCGLPTGVTLWNVTNRQNWCRLALCSLLPASQLQHRLHTVQCMVFTAFTYCSPMLLQHGQFSFDKLNIWATN